MWAGLRPAKDRTTRAGKWLATSRQRTCHRRLSTVHLVPKRMHVAHLAAIRRCTCAAKGQQGRQSTSQHPVVPYKKRAVLPHLFPRRHHLWSSEVLALLDSAV